MTAYFSVMSRYATFRGRASRAEFWQFSLVYMLVALVVIALDLSLIPAYHPGSGALVWLYGLFHALPGTAVLVRRLHDSDRSGWWALINITGIGTFVLLVFAMLRGTQGLNRFGPEPLWPLPPVGMHPRHVEEPQVYGQRGGAERGYTQPVYHQEPQQVRPAQTPSIPKDPIADLERLAKLRADGGLSDEEFQALKGQIIGR